MAAASAAPLFINEAIKMGTPSQPQVSFGGCKVRDTKALNSELCRNLYHSIPKPQKPIVMSASGVQNLVLAEASAKPWLHKPFKCLDCGPLFLKNGCYMEMIKGIQGHGYYDELVIPFLIMETTAREGELTDSLAEAIKSFWQIFDLPKPTAVIVRNHAIYLCVDSWISAKNTGFDWAKPSHGPKQILQRVLGGYRNAEVTAKARTSSNGIESPRRCIVLDIEGTTTPISFVTDVLFPYARDNVRKHLELTYDTEKTQDDIVLLRAQVQEDLENNVVEAVPIPSDGDREEVIAALVANVNAMIKADRKITSLKQLQGHIWQTGFQNKEIETVVYDDVPEALEKWQALGLKVYIYSSGSRLAQRLLFGNTNYGDLRKYLCGFFDTTIGNKRETKSYIEITESLGVDDPSEILFVTDVYQEATAAKAAGLEVTISVRPGNGPLPENHGFRTVNSFSEI